MTLAPKAPEERRRRILTATVDVLRERGFAGTRVTDIADAAGTSSGLVLYHFKSLEGALAEALTTLEDDFYAELAAELGGTARRRSTGCAGWPSWAPGPGPRSATGGCGWRSGSVRCAARPPGSTREQLDSRWRGPDQGGHRRGRRRRGSSAPTTPRT